MTRKERRQRKREETGELQGKGNPGESGRGGKWRRGGDQKHHRTVTIAH